MIFLRHSCNLFTRILSGICEAIFIGINCLSDFYLALMGDMGDIYQEIFLFLLQVCKECAYDSLDFFGVCCQVPVFVSNSVRLDLLFLPCSQFE